MARVQRDIGSLGPLERRQAFEGALARMMSRPKATRPFVILEHPQDQCFVQFRGSMAESLLFDVPALDRQVDFGLPSRVGLDVYREATLLAFETLEALRRQAIASSGLPYEPAKQLTLIESMDGTEDPTN